MKGGDFRLELGDCITVLPNLPYSDFIFADPPFNIGQKYQGYEDQKPEDEYVEFTKEWIRAAYLNLNPLGILAIHIPSKLLRLTMDLGYYEFGKEPFEHIIWHYRFGQCTWHGLIESKCHCLLYSKGDNWTWNPESIAVESDRVGYGDKRINQTDRGGKRPPFDVWGIPSDGPYWGRVTGNSKERRKGHPNQLPEVYLQRLIKAYTNLGDQVTDPFCGSGTSACVAISLGRKFSGCEISKINYDSILERVKIGVVRL